MLQAAKIADCLEELTEQRFFDFALEIHFDFKNLEGLLIRFDQRN